jgi:ubiquitin-protein ligase
VNLGQEVAFQNLVPGETYYLRSMNGPYEEIELVAKDGQLFHYRRLQRLINARNALGNPLGPLREPHAPVPAGAPRQNQRVETDMGWPHSTFYKINTIKRKGRSINPAVSRKLKRQTLSNVLAKGKLPILPGTGPGNTIRKMAGWPKKNFQGGRKTRKQRGGAALSRIQRNVTSASKQTRENPTGQQYYAMSEDNILHGTALLIGPRYEYGSAVKGTNLNAKEREAKRERAAAKFPYEECLFFFDIMIPEEYPAAPPKFKFLNARVKNYRLHPNLYGHGVHTVGEGTDEKVCLGLLNTFGTPEWKTEVTIWNILGAITSGVLVENPAQAEPGWTSLHDRNPEGIQYNRHVLYEAIDVTSMIYDMVVKAIPASANEKNLSFNETNIARGRVPPFVVPFLPVLAKRAYYALNFLIGKLEAFLEANGGTRSIVLPQATHHHPGKTANYGALIDRMKATVALIPPALRVNVVKANIKEIYRSLWEFSKPKVTLKNGTEVIMPYEQFAMEMEQMARESGPAVAAPAAAGSGANEENTTEYVYNNYNNQPNNGEE